MRSLSRVLLDVSLFRVFGLIDDDQPKRVGQHLSLKSRDSNPCKIHGSQIQGVKSGVFEIGAGDAGVEPVNVVKVTSRQVGVL